MITIDNKTKYSENDKWQIITIDNHPNSKK